VSFDQIKIINMNMKLLMFQNLIWWKYTLCRFLSCYHMKGFPKWSNKTNQTHSLNFDMFSGLSFYKVICKTCNDFKNVISCKNRFLKRENRFRKEKDTHLQISMEYNISFHSSYFRFDSIFTFTVKSGFPHKMRQLSLGTIWGNFGSEKFKIW
jgi:hypothetical protein